MSCKAGKESMHSQLFSRRRDPKEDLYSRSSSLTSIPGIGPGSSSKFASAGGLRSAAGSHLQSRDLLPDAPIVDGEKSSMLHTMQWGWSAQPPVGIPIFISTACHVSTILACTDLSPQTESQSNLGTGITERGAHLLEYCNLPKPVFTYWSMHGGTIMNPPHTSMPSPGWPLPVL